MSNKQLIRTEMLAKRKAIAPELRTQYDDAICKRILDFDKVQSADAIALYASDGFEPNLDTLIAPLQAMNKQLYFPRFVENAQFSYQMVALAPNELPDFELGKWNIRQLSARHLSTLNPLLSTEKLLWLIPGVAYSPQGIRLGRGKAIYDQMLCGGYKVGVFYSLQAVEKLPEESHDKRLDAVITENTTLRFYND